jgi:hypothetical protein
MVGVGCLKMNYTLAKMIDMNLQMHCILKCSQFEVLNLGDYDQLPVQHNVFLLARSYHSLTNRHRRLRSHILSVLLVLLHTLCMMHCQLNLAMAGLGRFAGDT